MSERRPAAPASPAREPVGDLTRGTLRGPAFRVVRWVLLALLRPLVGMRIEGLDRIPRSGPILVVCKHVHNADPVLLSVAFPRPVHFMAKKELFTVPIIGWVISRVGSFPVDRGKADRSALRHAEAALSQGIAVGMFPEGTRSTTGALQRAHPGAALLAVRSGAPVIPMVVVGSEALPLNGTKGRRPPASGRRRWDVRIRIGEPFTLPREVDGHKLDTETATEQMMVALARLLPPKYRGEYASRSLTPLD